MGRIRCFLIEPSDRVARSLRVQWCSCSECGGLCPASTYKSGHWAMVDYDLIAGVPYTPDERGIDKQDTSADAALLTSAQVAWPTTCQDCGIAFPAYDHDHDHDRRLWRYVDRRRLYRNVETGEHYSAIHQAPPGAMWRAPWMADMCASQDEGAPLGVMTPGGEWIVDMQASNCTIPADRGQVQHHCWVRHGIPPVVSVDKAGGPTCAAGAGSIQCGSYHGFLRNGYLEE